MTPLILLWPRGRTQTHAHTHTHTRIHSCSESDFKKPGTPGLKIWLKNYH